MSKKKINPLSERMKKGHQTTQEDIEFIRINANKMTDKELAKAIGCSTPSVVKIRGKFNTTKRGKKAKRTSQQIESELPSKVDIQNPSVINELEVEGMDDEDLRALFERLFKNSTQFEILKDMYTEKEVRYYLEEFCIFVSEVRSQGGEITSSEFRNLDQLIQLNIRRNRLTIEEKHTQDAIRTALDENSITDVTEETRVVVFQLQNAMKDVNKNLKDITEQSLKLHTSLDMVRVERVKRMANSEHGILRIIQNMQEDKKRALVEKQAGMLKASTTKARKKWKEEGFIFAPEE